MGKLGETHVSEGAEKHRVFSEKAEASEFREGGTREMRNGIPAVSDDDMNALPVEKWEHDNPR